MELHLSERLHAHHWERRQPDWLAAGVAGFVAGALLMTLELVWSASGAGSPVWRNSHQIAAIVMGDGALQSNAFSWSVVGAALATHYVLGIVFGLVLGAIVAPFRLDSSWHAVATIGALYGVLLYGLNFYLMTAAFPWMENLRGLTTFTAHVLFGVVAALAYRQLERPEDKR